LAKQPKILGFRVLGVVRVLNKKKLPLAKQPKILGFRDLNKKKTPIGKAAKELRV
jgi:hypothetical protein